MTIPIRSQYSDLIDRALAEDVGFGDVTTQCLGVADRECTAHICAREDGIIAGLFLAEATFDKVDPNIEFETFAKEGELVRSGAILATVRGGAGAILAGERVALNFLQRASGIATYTFRFVRAVKGTNARIVDTRKTAPGLRIIDKYAVRAGGGSNHRFRLDDAILIKDNHIVMAGGVGDAVNLARENKGHTLTVEVETTSVAEVKEAVLAGADVIMLDNMKLKEIEEAVDFIDGRAVVEVSGNVSLVNVSEIAALGVDVISVGALTHSPDALDIGMDFV